MSDPIKIIVTAETADAAARLQQFAAQASSGMTAEVTKASAAAQTNLRTANMMFIGMAQGMSAQMIAGMNPIQVMAVQAPAVIQALNMMGFAFKTMAPYALAAAAAAGVLTLEWKLFMAGTEDNTKRIEEMVAALDKVPGILERIAALQKAGVMSPAAAQQYADFLNGKKPLYVGPDGKVTPNPTSQVEELGTTGTTLYGGTPDNRTWLRTVQNREATQAEKNAYVATQPAFTVVAQAQADAKNKLDELLAKSSVEMLSGVDKDIEGIRQRYQKLRDDLKNTLNQAGGLAGKNEQAAVSDRIAALNAAEARQIAEARTKAQNEAVKQSEQDRKEIVLQQERELNSALDAYALATTTKTKEYWDTVYEAKATAARRAFAVDEDELALEKKLAEAARAHAAGVKQVADEEQRRAAAAREYARAQLEGQLAAINGNPMLTQSEKSQQSLPLLQAEQIGNLQRIAELEQIINSTTDDAARLNAQQEMNRLLREQAQLSNEITAAEGQNSFVYNLQLAMTRLRDMNNLAQELAQTLENAVNTALSSISQNLTGVIMGTQNWKQAMLNIGRDVVGELVQGMTHMAAEWLFQHTIMAAISSAFHLTNVAEHTAAEGAKTAATSAGTAARSSIFSMETLWQLVQFGIRTAGHLASQLAMTAVTIAQTIIRRLQVFLELQPYIILAGIEAGAAVASIPVIGPVLAPVAAAGTIAALEALAVFKDGGYVSGPGTGTSDSIPARLSNGEFVLRAPAVRRYGVGFLNDLNSENIERNSFASSSSPAPAIGVTKVVNVFDRDWLRRELSKGDYAQVIVNHVIANKNRMGLMT